MKNIDEPTPRSRRLPALLVGAALLMNGATAVNGQSKSGYGSSHSLEGGDSVTEDIQQDDINTGAAFPIRGQPLKPWFDAKRRWYDKYGLKLNFSLQTLHQHSNNQTGETTAAAGRAEINGSWELVGRGTKNIGKLTFRVENRSTLGTEIPPSKLGNQFGSGTLVGTGFSDYSEANLSELAWRQALMNGRFRFVFGKISAVGWYGAHALSSPKRGFQNTALQASNTRAFPGRGFGLGVGYEFTPRLVAVAGIHDANAKTTSNPFDTIHQGEFLKSVELRYYLSTPERARWDQVRLQLWHQDARVEANVPESYGASFVASKLMFGDRVMPFMLAGISSGGASIFEKDVAVGVSFDFDTTASKARDVLGIGLAWGDPSNSVLQEQVTGEIYYRFQILDNLAITPSVQMIRNPVAYPGKDTITVVGLRIRATF
ncbi:carbohydrate porin [Sedimentitalea sp. XS_ASV28]|uniref:carbohydrate porin n=1 Tax=Sedimentitalea sp. XS_ASV28 TaxID=3241296 RepID=UPI00351322D9